MEKTHNEKTREQLEKELEIVEKLQDAIRGQGGREMLLLRNNLYWLWRDLSAKIGNGNPASQQRHSNSALSNSKTIIGDQNEDKPNSTTERARTLSDPKLGVSHLHDAQRASRLQIQRAGSKTALS